MTKVSDVKACEGCPMLKVDTWVEENNQKLHWIGGDQNFVPPLLGSSKRLVVAEAPGFMEAEQGEPLVGSSGKVFDNLLRKAGIKRDGLNIINCINCRPPDNIFPTDAAARRYISVGEAEQVVQHCFKSHVEPVLKAKPWERIDALGAKALKILTGKTDGIHKWRGSPLPLRGTDTPIVMPTLHPSFLMKQQDFMPIVVSDLIKGLAVPPEHYNLTPTLEELDAYRPKTIAFDIETNRFTGGITMVGFSDKPCHSIVIPYRGAYVEKIKQIFAGAEQLVGQNCIQFDLPVLEQHGIKIGNEVQLWDVMLMFHLLHPDAPANDLEFISSVYTQKPAWKHLSGEDMALYNARDVDVTFQSFLQLKPLLRMHKLEDLYKFTLVPLAKICHVMTTTGVKCDGNRIKYAREKLEREMLELELGLPIPLRAFEKPIKVRKEAPAGTLGKSGKPIKFIHIEGTERVVPWASPQQVAKYLYETLKLPQQLHAKTKKVTTDKTALDRLSRYCKRTFPDKPELYSGIKALGKIKSSEELRTTFLKEGTVGVGRVHSNFLVHGTNTGRLASSGPNLQNQTPASKYIYVPSHDGWVFVDCDFSSLENRLAAYYANDTDRLARLAVPGFNEHRWIASQIYGIPEEEIDKASWQYDRGKHTNHGCDAGMGPRKMSIQYDVPEAECRDLIYKWRTINHKSYEWQQLVGNTAQTSGILATAFGRKRWFWSTSSYTDGIRFMTQSSGADICFKSMISLMYEKIHWPEQFALKATEVLAPLPFNARLIAQVHDSLLVECPLDKVHEVVKQMYKAMSQPWKELGGFSIPVAFKVGKPNDSWAEIEPIKLEDYLK